MDCVLLPKIYSKSRFPGGAVLEVVDIECVRGYRQLFANIGFRAESSSVTHLTGSNGSGKTSLLNIIAGLRRPDGGSVQWNGRGIHEARSEFQANLFYLGHRIALDGQLTPRENLSFLAGIGNGTDQQVDQCLEVMDVARWADVQCYQLSQGQKQRVALAGMLASSALVWLLDEPATALDRDAVELVEKAIATHSEAGGITVFTSHLPLANDVPNYRRFDLNST